ncbi:MAG: hypothetical protein IPP10_15785 [Candidatus Competibacteraceae bacterium]|nr:hypothetical protein [Candidatus Competibacteraceae bacterium]
MNATLQDAVNGLTRLGCKPKQSGDGWKAYCPIHEADGKPHTPSLTLGQGHTQPVVVHCQRGCDGLEILKALGVNGAAHLLQRPVATHPGSLRTAARSGKRCASSRKTAASAIRMRRASGFTRPVTARPGFYRLPELRGRDQAKAKPFSW